MASCVLLFCIILLPYTLSMPLNDESSELEREGDDSPPEYLWQFQELLRCTMGIDSIMDLLTKYNCSQCQSCFEKWNTGYYELNLHPICQQFEGQLFTLSYEYECDNAGYARCIKNPTRCQYETCKLDSKFIKCLQNIDASKFISE